MCSSQLPCNGQVQFRSLQRAVNDVSQVVCTICVEHLFFRELPHGLAETELVDVRDASLEVLPQVGKSGVRR